MATNIFEFSVLDNDGAPATLSINITDEGIIVDLLSFGEVTATFGATAQELADEYCH